MGQELPSVRTDLPRIDPRRVRTRRLVSTVLAVLALGAAAPLRAQAPITFRYFYDDAGQLQKVVDSTGVMLEYVYDSVGNILEIRRSTSPPGGLTLFNFTPGQGGPLTIVTLRGQGFSSSPPGNVVRFNGAAAAVLSATSDTLAVSVPVGATSGPISVTVAGITATSAVNFITSSVPVITSVTPSVIDVTRPPSGVQVVGVNLTGAAFAFLPVLQPSPLTIGSPTVNADGTVAMLPLTVAASARGRFTLVATNASGSADAFPSNRNTLWVISAQDNSDTDGDGVPDALELLLGSDPFDPASVPAIKAAPEAETLTFSLLNGTSPPSPSPGLQEVDSVTMSLRNGTAPPPPPSNLMEIESGTFALLNGIRPPTTPPAVVEAESLTFSLLNGTPPPSPTPLARESESLTVSLINGTPPPPPSSSAVNEIDGLTVSLVNGTLPTPPPSSALEVESLTVSLLNGTNPPPAPAIFELDGPTFSLFNSVGRAENRQPAGNHVELVAASSAESRPSAKPSQSRARAFLSSVIRLPVRAVSFFTREQRSESAMADVCPPETEATAAHRVVDDRFNRPNSRCEPAQQTEKE